MCKDLVCMTWGLAKQTEKKCFADEAKVGNQVPSALIKRTIVGCNKPTPTLVPDCPIRAGRQCVPRLSLSGTQVVMVFLLVLGRMLCPLSTHVAACNVRTECRNLRYICEAGPADEINLVQATMPWIRRHSTGGM